MKNLIFAFGLFFTFAYNHLVLAEEDHTAQSGPDLKPKKAQKANQDEESKEKHDHDHEHDKKAKDKHDDHSKKDLNKQSEHSEDEGEGGHDDEGSGEGNPQVGPTKGILAANPDDGIQISPEAEKNFSVRKIKVTNPAMIEIPASAVVTTGVEVNLYRYRDGFYKRIDYEKIRQVGDQLVVRSDEVKNGDEIALTGLGFIRIAELSAFGGAPTGHSH